MNAKLSPLMLNFLRKVDAGVPNPEGGSTARALWLRGLIVDVVVPGRGHTHWKLTPEGKLALQHGRQMLSRRAP